MIEEERKLFEILKRRQGDASALSAPMQYSGDGASGVPASETQQEPHAVGAE
jgi:hypothetical protein